MRRVRCPPSPLFLGSPGVLCRVFAGFEPSGKTAMRLAILAYDLGERAFVKAVVHQSLGRMLQHLAGHDSVLDISETNFDILTTRNDQTHMSEILF